MTSDPLGAEGDHCSIEWASRFSHRIIVEWDFPQERPAARTPNPSVRTLIAEATFRHQVRSLAIGVPVR